MRTRLLMLGSLFGLFCSLPVITANASTDTMLQAAFIRNGDLWVKINGTERQITREKSVSSPRWSYDGKWIAYFVTADSEFNDKNTLRVRNVKTNQDTIVAVFQNHTCENIAWSPKSDVLAFQNGTILNDIAMNNIREQGFRNVSLGVAQFAWLPDGNGFLVSSSAQLLPDGWTRARLYAISLSPGKSLINTATPFYDLPKEVDVSGTKVLVIGTSTFKWSPIKNGLRS
ncbi:TolB family protein [Alicyclobacillus dauci]|uniref:WD40-like Beta Propeller Repeat n=1 Tax=Alicyclobacillus dauci TaxID=1475485 RepID=A0ABY6Z4F5_9BACL|nr:hypothetical protein [Alicyclobacillus dauci]WAH37528.1 hypothetical protein NZD86_03045 [Alicyclobacillus dauci]